MKATNRFCIKHGGDVGIGSEFLCDTCARSGINPCKCGSHARIFGEALMSIIHCETCDQFISGVDIPDIKKRWNQGERGWIENQL